MNQHRHQFGNSDDSVPDVTEVEQRDTVAQTDSTDSVDSVGTQTITVSYSDDVIATLLYMIEEEKLAGDIYEAYFDLYGLKIFDNIAESEDQHFDALINQAETIGIDVDEFLFEESGTFVNEELQAMYDELLEVGSQSVIDALEVGVLIEEKDLVDIVEAVEEAEGTTLASVYDNLLTGSTYHLDAFESALLA
ncbi:DUF2202 domain-containing protein [Thalassovita taeanensis]|nr:DUF2202 domain-containing protein [Thalassovita taeanensis]